MPQVPEPADQTVALQVIERRPDSTSVPSEAKSGLSLIEPSKIPATARSPSEEFEKLGAVIGRATGSTGSGVHDSYIGTLVTPFKLSKIALWKWVIGDPRVLP
jgi:hypothetical protein